MGMEVMRCKSGNGVEYSIAWQRGLDEGKERYGVELSVFIQSLLTFIAPNMGGKVRLQYSPKEDICIVLHMVNQISSAF